MRPPRHSLTLLAALAVSAVPLVAQLQHTLAFTTGPQELAAPHWTNAVADQNATTGKVVQLEAVHRLDLRSPSAELPPGTFVARVRLARTGDVAGAVDFTIRVQAANKVLGSSVLPARAQTPGSYVWSEPVLFTLGDPTTVEVVVQHGSDAEEKRGYRFDCACIGRVPIGPVLRHESLTTWTFDNPAWFAAEEVEPSASFGRVARRNARAGFTWLELRQSYELPAGRYSATLRVRNRNGPAAGAQCLKFEVRDEQKQPLQVVKLPSGVQVADQWVQTPDLVFELTEPRTVTFALHNHAMRFSGYGYEFDSFSLRAVADAKSR